MRVGLSTIASIRILSASENAQLFNFVETRLYMNVRFIRYALGMFATLTTACALAAPPQVADDLITVEFDGEKTTALSLEVGAENNINIGSISAGGGAGKATFKELTLTKLPDEMSSELLESLVLGRHYERVRIFAGSVAIELQLVLVQDFSLSASECEQRSTTTCNPQEETVVLQFGALQYRVE